LSRDWTLIKSFKSKFIELLRQYYYIGGMPEAVYSFANENDFK
jgi:predicted AAA+ superfamily ATPase